MKKLILLLTILNCSLTFAQEKTFSFDKKLTYKIDIPEAYEEYLENKNISLTFYIGKDALLGNLDGTEFFDGFKTDAFLSTNKKVFDVNASSLENNLTIKTPSYYYEEAQNTPYSDNIFGDDFTLNKVNTSDIINGYSCNNYELISKNSDQTTNICVDEKSEINNMRFLLPNHNLKGLLISLKSDQQGGYTLNKISNTSLKSTFNESESIENYNKVLTKLKSEYDYTDPNEVAVDSVAVAYDDYFYDYTNDPINLYYNYANSENENINSIFYTISGAIGTIVSQNNENRLKALNIAEATSKQIVKQYKKNSLLDSKEAKELNQILKKYFEDAKNYTPTTPEYAAVEVVDDYPSVSYEPYSSVYQNLNLNDMNFAYTGYNEEENLINTMPKYCINTVVPDFKNVAFKKNVENYIGQLCDLYISKFVYNVGITETTDALRYSFLKINELKSKLSKEEQTKFDQFINNLD